MARGEKFWEKVLAAVDDGETQGSVAERFGVSLSTVRYWIAKRRHDGMPEMLPVRVAARSNVGVELEVGGVVVRVPGTADPAYVAELVRALRSC
jgi:transposase-like protein